MATRARILDSSVRLFSERGYSGTSLRAIADAAGTNLAAAHYHFGSKAQLLEAAFTHCIAPINEARMQRLAVLEAAPEPPGVEDLVRAFVDVRLTGGEMPQLQHFVARLLAEPKALSVPLLQRAFGPTVQPFYAALKRILPAVQVQDLQWRFHFLIGSMIQLANFDTPLNLYEPDQAQVEEVPGAGIDQLVQFAVAGITQGAECGGTA
jgi:AcrR family transcriptional regulator